MERGWNGNGFDFNKYLHVTKSSTDERTKKIIQLIYGCDPFHEYELD